MDIMNVFNSISKCYVTYSEIKRQLKINELDDLSIYLYTNLLFDFSYEMEMLYQDNDVFLYSEGEINNEDIKESLNNSIVAVTRLMHFLNINELRNNEEYKYVELLDILNLIKGSLFELNKVEVETE